ncbi:MAG: class I SAM-dependent methyltransferase [Acidobacteriota bacterium]
MANPSHPASESAGSPPGPLVAAFWQALGTSSPTERLAVHPSDEMLAFLVDQHRGDRDQALAHYLRSGHAIADAYLQIIRWHFGTGYSEDVGASVDSLLDFASGFGRVTRFLVESIPAERVWVSDLYDEGVAFQRKTLGVQGFPSTVDPKEFHCEERFDVILATSLFSHLRADRFQGWLDRLASLLTERGLLIFSVHDASLLPPDQKLPPEGIAFRPISESSSHDGDDYGSAWVSEAFVRQAVGQTTPLGEGHRLVRLPRGLCNFQDLYVAARGPRGPLSSPGDSTFEGDPHFFLESCDVLPGGRLRLTGWAAAATSALTAGDSRSPPKNSSASGGASLEVWLGGEVWGSCAVDLDRPEAAAFTGTWRCGWALEGSLPEGFRPTDPLVIRLLTADHRRSHIVHIATVLASSLGCCEERLRWLQEELHRRESRWAAERDAADRRHGAEVAAASEETRQLSARLAAMEASRFWKLRNAWFTFKRRFGLAGGGR